MLIFVWYDILLLRSLELEREETSRLNRQIEELKKAHHQSENKMSCQLKQIAKEKEDLLIRYVKTPQATFKLTVHKSLISKLLLIISNFIYSLNTEGFTLYHAQI